MTGWLNLTDEQRKVSLQQAFIRSGINAKAIEKDWWVTLCLKALFSTPYARFFIFKGGTSLSKGWKLIQRFSEDIDIALDPEAFGRQYVKAPSHSYVKTLKREGCAFTNKEIKAGLEDALTALGVVSDTVTVEAAPVPDKIPDRDPQTLFIRYRSLYDPNPYLADEVKIEFGVRSLKVPFAPVQIQSILTEIFPSKAYEETPTEVMAVEPRKTFLEKIFLLHEKFAVADASKIKTERMSRHLYDIVQLMKSGAAEAALQDKELYANLRRHREEYIRVSGVDYETLAQGKISFIPPDELQGAFRQDYASMQEQMIYIESLPFDELMVRLSALTERFREQ